MTEQQEPTELNQNEEAIAFARALFGPPTSSVRLSINETNTGDEQ